MHPVNAPVSQAFGQKNQASGSAFPHTGEDFACPIGAAVRTIAPGTIIYAGYDLPDNLADKYMMVRGRAGSGLQVLIQHDGWVELMAHLSAILVKTGQAVARGDIVALSGNTGNSTGPHLHYETMTPPYTSYYPFGRYDPELQIALEDSKTLATTGGTITEEWFDMWTDDEKRRLLAAADRINGTIPDRRYGNGEPVKVAMEDTVFSKADGAYQNRIINEDLVPTIGRMEGAIDHTLDKDDGGSLREAIEKR